MTIIINDSQGKQVSQLADGHRPAEHNTISWDTGIHVDGTISAGLYFCKIETDAFITPKRGRIV